MLYWSFVGNAERDRNYSETEEQGRVWQSAGDEHASNTAEIMIRIIRVTVFKLHFGRESVALP